MSLVELSVYTEPDEKSDIEAAADEAGLSVSKYVRTHVPECDP